MEIENLNEKEKKMKNVNVILSVLLMAVTLMNCANNPQAVYEREILPITEEDVPPANLINARYLLSNNLEQVKYVLMHVAKYKMKFPQVDYRCLEDGLVILEKEGSTQQIRLMAYLTKKCLNDSVKITDPEKFIKMMDPEKFYSEILKKINKNDSRFLAYEE